MISNQNQNNRAKTICNHNPVLKSISYYNTLTKDFPKITKSKIAITILKNVKIRQKRIQNFKKRLRTSG